MQQLNWDDLRIFLALSTRQSTRRAAVDLGLDGSTVGRRLKALERDLGAQLFERLPEGLRLTTAGSDVLSIVNAMQERVRELERRVVGTDDRIAGCVRLTVAEVMAAIVCQCLGPFVERNPQLEVELVATDVMVDVERHEAEVAVRVAGQPPPQLVGRRVAQSAVGLYASKEYVARWGRDLKQPAHAWVAWPRQVERKPAFLWLQQHYPERRQVVRASSATGVLQAVKSGLGVAPLACAQAAGESGLALLKRLPATCSTSVWLLAHAHTKDTARVRAVLDYLFVALRTRSGLIDGTQQ